MIYLLLIVEFFIIGTFAVGGGLATLPYLYSLADRYPWFDKTTLIDMIAISESTPGPIGINMATFAGFKAGGILGGVLASLSIIITGTIFMLIISNFLDKFKDHVLLKKVFYGIRPMVAALIAYAGYEMFTITILNGEALKINFLAFGIFIVASIVLLKTKLSPILLILFAAILGIFIPIV